MLSDVDQEWAEHGHVERGGETTSAENQQDKQVAGRCSALRCPHRVIIIAAVHRVILDGAEGVSRSFRADA
jgi:hypothetical protein